MKKLLIPAVLATAFTTQAFAAPEAKLDGIKAALWANQPQKAFSGIYEMLVELTDRTPMYLTKAALVTKPAEGYGMYEERPNAVFAPDEPIRIYAEPFSYKLRQEGGRFKFGVSMDFQVLTEKGEVLGGQENFQTSRFDSHQPNMELFVNATLTLTGLPSGKYQALLVLHDVNKPADTATARLPFSVK